MDLIANYFIKNFVVICVAIVLIVTLSRKFKTNRHISLYLILIVSLTVLITIFDYIQYNLQESGGNVLLITFICGLLYVLRPLCLVLFILLSGQRIKNVFSYIILGLFIYNIVIVSLAFIPATRTLVFYFVVNTENGKVNWSGGDIDFFRYTPHIVSIFYLLFLVYRSVSLSRRKHFFDAISILCCAVIVSTAVLLETLPYFNPDNEVYVLPSSIAISAIFYYLFLYERNNKLDTLTLLFNRASYFDDVSRFNKEITGVIQLDMNGLKYLNDNYGHLEGDNGLRCIANTIGECLTWKMYAYRLGGDEFIVLAINESEENILKFVTSFKEKMKTTKYYCSVGYAIKNENLTSVAALFKASEEEMYKDKAEFYKTSKIERRKSHYIEEE